jgi:hypothetical protein
MFPPITTTSPVVCGTAPSTRVYNPSAAAFADVLLADQAQLGSMGWTPVAMVGTTAERPRAGDAGIFDGSMLRGQTYVDTTLGAVIEHDGRVWRNVLTGAAV